MRKFSLIPLCFFISIGIIHHGICSSVPENKGKLTLAQRGSTLAQKGSTLTQKGLTLTQKGMNKVMDMNKWKEVKKSSDTENILKDLKKINALSDSTQIYMVLNTTAETALSAKQIIFVRDQDNNIFVIKRFNTLAGFQEEKKGLDNVNETIIPKIKALKATCKLPKITSGKAFPNIDKIGVVVLEAGRGDPLFDRFIEKLSTVSEQSIIESFTSIGEQSGCLDRESYKNYKMVPLHNDGHARNFTYHDSTKAFDWIDTSGIYLSDMRAGRKTRTTGIDKLDFLFQIAGSKERNDQLEEWLKKANQYRETTQLANISSLSPRIKKELEGDLAIINNARKKDILAIESFKKGYLSTNPEQEADCQASIDFIMDSVDASIVSNKIKEYNASFKCP